MQQFTVPLKLVSLNEYISKAKSAGGHPRQKYKHDVQQSIVYCIKAGKIRRIKRPCYITFIWYEQTRRRDKDNVAFGKKFILDAMQEAKILQNDNNEWIKGFSDYFVYGQGQKVIVKIEEVDEVSFDVGIQGNDRKGDGGIPE